MKPHNNRKERKWKRRSKEGSANRVVAAKAGKPMSGAGYSLTGTKDAASISVERPGKGTQSCKA